MKKDKLYDLVFNKINNNRYEIFDEFDGDIIGYITFISRLNVWLVRFEEYGLDSYALRSISKKLEELNK